MQLYINSYGTYVHVKDQMFEILVKEKDGRKKHYFSAKKIQSIILAEHTALSAAAVKLAVSHNIDIVFTEKNGQPIGRVWHSRLGSTSKIRKAQLQASLNAEGLKVVKEWIGLKMENEFEFLKKLKKHRKQHHDFLQDKIERIEKLSISLSEIDAPDVASAAERIRGLEGTSGRLFFEALNKVLPKEHQFKGRSFRPAKDPFNAFLNYAFGILYSKIEKSLIIAGLDPYLGYLHRDDYNQLSFVFDFIEPYRIYATEVVFKLFSGKKVNQSHTDEITNGLTLNKSGKELLVEAYNQFTESDTIRYKGRNQTRNNAIQADAHSYANSLIRKTTDDAAVKDIDKMFDL